MPLFLTIVGIFLGASYFGLEGSVVGALLGWLLGSLLQLQGRLGVLERRVRFLEGARRVPRGAPAAQAEAAAAGPEWVAEPEPSPEVATTASEAPQDAISETSVGASQPAPMPGRGAPPASLPEWIGTVWQAVRGYVAGGNLAVRLGVVILFFGVAFLLKYAAEHQRLPAELRLIGVAVAAAVLLVLGWRLRQGRANYGLALQGGGVGLLYLTVFAALRLYEVIPAGFAFALLLAIAVFAAVLALLQDSRSLAVLGSSGGFLAPVLASTGGGSHVMLFGYFALLNTAILGIAWFKAWRSLNLVGFVFTLVLGSAWGRQFYRPEHFASVEPFLVLFFLFYVAIAVLFAARQPPDVRGYVDGPLVFGTPLFAFALQAAMVYRYPYAMAWSALGAGLLYVGLAWILLKKGKDTMRVLTQAFLALGVGFGTLAIPLALDARWTAALWALEGAALVWVGVRQQRWLVRGAGVLLQLGAGILFAVEAGSYAATLPVVNGFFTGCVVVSGAGLFTAFHLYRHRATLRPEEASAGVVLFVWGTLWWLLAGLHEIDRQAPPEYGIGAVLLFLSGTAVVASVGQRRLAWSWPRYSALALLPALALVASFQWAASVHPSARAGGLGWAVAVTAHYWILRRDDPSGAAYLRYLHAGAVWLLAWLGSWEAGWALHRVVGGADTWRLVAWAVVPASLTVAIAWIARLPGWPIGVHRDTYLGLGAGPLVAWLLLWTVFANLGSTGDASPLAYLPVLNPLDVAMIYAFLSAIFWLRELRAVAPDTLASLGTPAASSVLAGAAFLWLSATVVRTVHHWGGVPMAFPAMFDSVLLQASLSLFWSLLALLIMVFATRRALRLAWMAGAGLLGVVVVKLFVVDLAGAGTLERIVSFIGVGILLLIVGYLSPVPPRLPTEAGAPP